ncbi:helix-turn-helix domain-containing protein [Treponema endosymbiont of Eucomonympha sp.]|uniref:helix-turn-helix domain-containing protein n=2 Tax=Treponema endosymbiont of Eucomonympha sp. TaxID=1580831 RepID=UPI000782D42E|nr:helix-turn-helix domain-containing protein [Treponema endosymbiont of Eucomonympha sp.]
MAGNQAPQTQAAKEPQFYSLKETAGILGCSKANVSRLTKLGKLPCVRIGSYPLFARAYIDGLIAQAMGTAASGEVAQC